MISIAKWNGHDVLGTINKGKNVLENVMKFSDYPQPGIEYFCTRLARAFGQEKLFDIPLDELTLIITNDELKLRCPEVLEQIEANYKEAVGNKLIGV